MTRSDSIATLAGALAKAQAELSGAVKDSVNPHFKSKYADLASIWVACRHALPKHGLAVLQPVASDGPSVTITTLLVHSSGEWLAEALTMRAQQDTPQAIGSAITYGRRYGLAAMVGIAPEDDDGEAATAGAPKTANAEPSGYLDWFESMEAVTAEGIERLRAAFLASPKPMREYATGPDAARWAALKAKAPKGGVA